MTTMLAIAKHTVARAQETGKEITNLQLQIILFYLFIEAKEKCLVSGCELQRWYDAPFQLWRYGPVVESIHYHYCVFGASHLFRPEETDERFSVFNDAIDRLLVEEPMDLIYPLWKTDFYQTHQHHIEHGKSRVCYKFEDLTLY